jgi:hypothetical protein
MNSFKIKSIDEQFVIVDYTVNGKVRTDKYDARYMPMEAEALTERLNEHLLGFTRDAETPVVEVSADAKALIGVKVDIVEPDPVVTE